MTMNKYDTLEQIESDLAAIDERMRAIQGRVQAVKAQAKQTTKAIETEIFDAAVMVSAKHFNVHMAQILSRCRPVHVADARQVAMSQAYERSATISHPRTGRMFGRDHGTIIHAVKAVRSKRETDPHFRAKVEAVERELDQILNGGGK